MALYDFTGNGYENIDFTRPQGNEQKRDGDDAIRQTRQAGVTFAEREHQLGGQHLRWYAVSSGIANAEVLDMPHSFPVLEIGMYFYFKPAAANTGATTLTVINNDSVSFGPFAIKQFNADLVAGSLDPDQVFLVVWNGTDFSLLNDEVPATPIAFGTITSKTIAFDTEYTNSGTQFLFLSAMVEANQNQTMSLEIKPPAGAFTVIATWTKSGGGGFGRNQQATAIIGPGWTYKFTGQGSISFGFESTFTQ